MRRCFCPALIKNNRNVTLFFDNHGIRDTCDGVSTPINELLHDLIRTDNVDVFLEMHARDNGHVVQQHDDSYLIRTIDTLYPYVSSDEQNTDSIGKVYAIDIRDMINQDIHSLSFPTQAFDQSVFVKRLIQHFYSKFQNKTWLDVLAAVWRSYDNDYPVLTEELSKLSKRDYDDLHRFYRPIIRDEVYKYANMFLSNLWYDKSTYTVEKYERVQTSLIAMTSGILDMYTLARLFNNHNRSCVMYCGEWHMTNIMQFLLLQNFTSVLDSSGTGRCLNIKDLFLHG